MWFAFALSTLYILSFARHYYVLLTFSSCFFVSSDFLISFSFVSIFYLALLVFFNLCCDTKHLLCGSVATEVCTIIVCGKVGPWSIYDTASHWPAGAGERQILADSGIYWEILADSPSDSQKRQYQPISGSFLLVSGRELPVSGNLSVNFSS